MIELRDILAIRKFKMLGKDRFKLIWLGNVVLIIDFKIYRVR